MRTQKPAVGTTVVVAVVLVVLVVVGAGYYLLGQGGGKSVQNTSSSTTSTTSATTSSSSTTSTSSIRSSSSSSTISSSSSASNSSSSSTTSVLSSNSSSTFNGRVVIIFAASTLLASSDVVANYSMKIDELGSVPSTLSLTATAPAGITVTLSPSEYTTGGPASPMASIRVDPSTKPGMYGVNVTAAGGGATYSSTVSVQVVTYLVVTVGTQFLPQNMTVPVGSTVFWIRLNGVINQYDNGDHNIIFLDKKAYLPTLMQYDTYSFQFTAAGDYPYYCSFHPLMKGDITVTS